MSRGARIVAGLLVLAAVLGGGVLAYRWAAPAQPPRPDFTLPGLDGEPRSVSEFDGDVLVLNFWATWCAPCRREIPMLVEAQDDYGDDGLTIVGIAVDTRGAAADFAREYEIDYPVLVDPTEAARVQDRYTGADTPAGVLPYTVVVNRSGRIVARVAGELTRAHLDRLVQGPLEAPPPAEAR